MILQCKACSFNTNHLPEMTEHLAGSGHTEYDSVKPTEHQKELYSEPGPVIRTLRVPYNAEERRLIGETAMQLAVQQDDLEQQLVLTKEQIKAIATSRKDLAAKVRDGHKNAQVECRWEVMLVSNEKALRRLDTNEVVETRALSAEDLSRERERVAAANAAQPAKAEGATA
jgi:hypothetical protein